MVEDKSTLERLKGTTAATKKVKNRRKMAVSQGLAGGEGEAGKEKNL